MELIQEVLKKYGSIIIAGAVGAIIRRFRESMTFLEFVQTLVIGVFISYCVGVIVEEYFTITEHFKYVIGAISAVYSKEILDEIKEIISNLGELINSWLKNKFN